MLNSFFKENSEFTYNYFSALLNAVKNNKRNFPQGIIFEGADTKLQLLFSLELARLLNCTNDENCINCKWIRDFAHPAVNLVSQIHFKSEGDTSSTVISQKQAQLLESSIKLTSDYYRFFIFFSSKECEYAENELQYFKEMNYNTDKINFSIEPLENKTFSVTVLNSLLKSIEEPPKNTTFVFLTKSKENIIPTIVSRCQVFKLSSNINNKKQMIDFYDYYSNLNINNIFEKSNNLIELSKNEGVPLIGILNSFIEFLKNFIYSDQNNYTKILADIQIIDYTIKAIKAKSSEKNAIETMFLRLLRGY